MRTDLPLHDLNRGVMRRRHLLIAGALASCLGGHQPLAADTSVAPRAIQLGDYGAVCDGATDDSPAIERALVQARKLRLPLVIPAGRCAFGDVIRLDGVTLTGNGAGSVLHALNWRRSAIFMSGAGPSVSNVKLTGVAAPSRQANWESTKITIFGATDFVIDGVIIEGAPAASIQTAKRATRGRITNNVIRNSLSDSIHMTDGASQILVENNHIEYSGDDGIAVVSYRGDGARVSNITARNNVVLDNKWGRNMSVVGGQHILYENYFLSGNPSGGACLYIAQEKSYKTYSALDVTVNRNTFQDCGGVNSGHAAAMIYSDGEEANNDIKLTYNDIIQKGLNGVKYFGPQTNVRIENNRIAGARTAYVGGAVPGVTVIPYTGGEVGYVAR
jgi:hypothetical protein